MSDLHVTSSVLGAVAGELESVATGLRTGLGSLDGEVSGLLGPGWSGEAASAYDAVWREWHDGAQQVVDGLATMSGLLATRRSGTTRPTRRVPRGVGDRPVSGFQVDPAALLAVVDRMSEFDSQLEAHLAQAASSVAPLGTSWYGDGGRGRAFGAAALG